MVIPETDNGVFDFGSDGSDDGHREKLWTQRIFMRYN